MLETFLPVLILRLPNQSWAEVLLCTVSNFLKSLHRSTEGMDKTNVSRNFHLRSCNRPPKPNLLVALNNYHPRKSTFAISCSTDSEKPLDTSVKETSATSGRYSRLVKAPLWIPPSTSKDSEDEEVQMDLSLPQSYHPKLYSPKRPVPDLPHALTRLKSLRKKVSDNLGQMGNSSSAFDWVNREGDFATTSNSFSIDEFVDTLSRLPKNSEEAVFQALDEYKDLCSALNPSTLSSVVSTLCDCNKHEIALKLLNHFEVRKKDSPFAISLITFH